MKNHNRRCVLGICWAMLPFFGARSAMAETARMVENESTSSVPKVTRSGFVVIPSFTTWATQSPYAGIDLLFGAKWDRFIISAGPEALLSKTNLLLALRFEAQVALFRSHDARTEASVALGYGLTPGAFFSSSMGTTKTTGPINLGMGIRYWSSPSVSAELGAGLIYYYSLSANDDPGSRREHTYVIPYARLGFVFAYGK